MFHSCFRPKLRLMCRCNFLARLQLVCRCHFRPRLRLVCCCRFRPRLRLVCRCRFRPRLLLVCHFRLRPWLRLVCRCPRINPAMMKRWHHWVIVGRQQRWRHCDMMKPRQQKVTWMRHNNIPIRLLCMLCVLYWPVCQYSTINQYVDSTITQKDKCISYVNKL